MTKMELDGMKNGCFPMDKEEGAIACEAYRAALRTLGYITWLEHVAGDLFVVRYEKREIIPVKVISTL